jgi:hypothetical protein
VTNSLNNYAIQSCWNNLLAKYFKKKNYVVDYHAYSSRMTSPCSLWCHLNMWGLRRLGYSSVVEHLFSTHEALERKKKWNSEDWMSVLGNPYPILKSSSTNVPRIPSMYSIIWLITYLKLRTALRNLSTFSYFFNFQTLKQVSPFALYRWEDRGLNCFLHSIFLICDQIFKNHKHISY